MIKQLGVTTVELLIGITFASSIAAYTLSMSEEVESQIKVYQDQNDIKKMKARIQSKNRTGSN